MFKGLRSLILALFITPSLGFAQQTDYTGANTANIPHDLSLDEAIRIALARNYGSVIGQNEVERAELEKTRSKDNLLPSVNATAGYDYRYSLTEGSRRFGSFVAAPGTQSADYNLGASYNLYNGGGDRARIAAATHSLEAAQGNYTWTKQEIAYNTTSAYLNALRFRELVGSAEKTLTESQAQLERLRGLNQAGSIPIAQVYQQEAVVGQNELSLIQAKNNFENAKADVLFILDVPPNTYETYNLNLTGIDTTTTSERRNSIAASVSDAQLASAIDTRPDIAAERAHIEALRVNIDVIRAALYPSVDLNVGVGGGGSGERLTNAQFSNSATGGVSVRIPIFDKFQNRLLIEEQEVELRSEETRLRQQEQGIRSDVAKAVNNLRASEQALDASARALRSAEESLRLAEERLKVGAGIQLDVIVAQSQLETARTNRVNAIFNFVQAQKQIDYTLGNWRY